MKRFGGLLVVLAGCLWGSMGLFVRTLSAYGFTTLQIAALRLLTAAVMLLPFGLAKKGDRRMSLGDFFLLVVMGLVSIAAMSVCYFTTIQLSSLSTAAVLLYTSPVFVTLLSAAFLHERLNGQKLLALALAVCGCVLVAGLSGALPAAAVVSGLLSAVTYASYSIFGRFALRRCAPLTVTVVAFSAAAVALLCCCRPAQLWSVVATRFSLPMLLWVLAAGFFTAVAPFLLYTVGLRTTEASRASVLACSEPAAATLFGFAVYGEVPTPLAFTGMALIFVAIVLLSFGRAARE